MYTIYTNKLFIIRVKKKSFFIFYANTVNSAVEDAAKAAMRYPGVRFAKAELVEVGAGDDVGAAVGARVNGGTGEHSGAGSVSV